MGVLVQKQMRMRGMFGLCNERGAEATRLREVKAAQIAPQFVSTSIRNGTENKLHMCNMHHRSQQRYGTPTILTISMVPQMGGGCSSPRRVVSTPVRGSAHGGGIQSWLISGTNQSPLHASVRQLLLVAISVQST